MAFKYGYRIERGVYQGKVLTTTTPFPQATTDYPYISGNVDGYEWRETQAPFAVYFNEPGHPMMIDVTGYFNVNHLIGQPPGFHRQKYIGCRHPDYHYYSLK